MDNVHKSSTASNSMTPTSFANFSCTDAGVNNENEPSQEMASKLKNPKKQSPTTKHFMSPTISAASKAVVPRKKILGERNEALDEVLQPSLKQPFTFDSKASKLPPVAHDDHNVQNNFVADSCLLPYDPIRNYLSPRPKFLRYNPNRRRRIFLRKKNDDCAENRRTSLDAEKPSSEEELEADSSSAGSLSPEEFVDEVEEKIEKGTGEAEGEDEGEEDLEEFEEDRNWSFGGFLKFFLVMVSVMMTTLCISLMNSPIPSPFLEAIWGFKGQCRRIHGTVYGVVGMNFSEVGSAGVCSWVQPDLGLEFEKRGIDHGLHKQSVAVDEMKGLVETFDALVEAESRQTENLDQDEMGSKGEISSESEKVNDEIYLVHDENKSESQEEIYYQLQEPEIASGEEVIGTHETESEKQVSVQSWVADFNTKDGDNEEEGFVASQKNRRLNFDVEIDLQEMEDVVESKVNNIGVVKTESRNTETTNVLKKLARLEWPSLMGLFGVSVLMFASLNSIYYLKHKKSSPLVEKMVVEAHVPEEEKVREGEHFATSLSLVHQTAAEEEVYPASLVAPLVDKEVSVEVSHIRAPTVELLGEFVIGGGGEPSSSLRSCGMKDSSILAKSEECNFSISHGTKNVSSIQSGAISSSLELSTADSYSYGSFTAENKIVKKQRHKNAEVSSIVAPSPSPLRRSSRIQKRSVTSP